MKVEGVRISTGCIGVTSGLISCLTGFAGSTRTLILSIQSVIYNFSFLDSLPAQHGQHSIDSILVPSLTSLPSRTLKRPCFHHCQPLQTSNLFSQQAGSTSHLLADYCLQTPIFVLTPQHCLHASLSYHLPVPKTEPSWSV